MELPPAILAAPPPTGAAAPPVFATGSRASQAVGPAWWLLPTESRAGLVAATFFTARAAWALPTSQVHQWAHMTRPPRAVRWLQRARVILPPAAHRAHYASPYATQYCITTG
jgi:hypothetical protein